MWCFGLCSEGTTQKRTPLGAPHDYQKTIPDPVAFHAVVAFCHEQTQLKEPGICMQSDLQICTRGGIGLGFCHLCWHRQET